MPWQAAVAGLGALGGLGGALSNTKAARTSTSEFNRTGSESGSSTSKRKLTPEQQAAMEMLAQINAGGAANPMAVVEPMRQFGRSQVNANFAGVEDIINQKYGTSGARTGKAGGAARAAELARLGQLTGVDRDTAGMAMQERERALMQLMQLLGMAFETESNFSSTSQQSGTEKSVRPGSAMGGALSGGIGGIFAGLGFKP